MPDLQEAANDAPDDSPAGLVGYPTSRTAAVRKVREPIGQVARFECTALTGGESGTGKYGVARELHIRSARASGPFVPVNCGAIPAELLESELFGYEKGAFTGALATRRGRWSARECDGSHASVTAAAIERWPLLLLSKIDDENPSLRAIIERECTAGRARRVDRPGCRARRREAGALMSKRRELLVGASIDRRFGAAELQMKATLVRGFSLVELVVLLTMLGIVAAFAVPKFVALDSQARTAAINGLAGSVKSAAALARSLAMAGGNTDSVTMESSTVRLLNSFPDASPTGIQRAVNSNSGANGEFTFATGSGSTTAATWTRNGAPIPASCSVSYTAASSNGGPTVAVTTSGC